MVELNLITDVLLFWWGYLFKSTSFNSECIRPDVIISWEMKGTFSFKDFFPSTWVHTGRGKEVELNCARRKLWILCMGSFPSWGIWGMARASLQDLQVTPCKLIRVEWAGDLGQVCLGYWKLGLSSHLGKFNSSLKTPPRCTLAYSRCTNHSAQKLLWVCSAVWGGKPTWCYILMEIPHPTVSQVLSVPREILFW